MKNLLLIIAFVAIPIFSNSQEIIKDEIDEFTGKKIKITSWEVLFRTINSQGFFNLSQLNESTNLGVKLCMNNKVFSIDKGAKLMMKLTNGEIVELKNIKYVITEKGDGARGLNGAGTMGIHAIYNINKSQLDLIKLHSIQKIRIYTNNSYFDLEIKSKHASVVNKSIDLIL